MSTDNSGKQSDGLAQLARLFALKREELVPALLSAMYFFSLLLCYYLLRPVRELLLTTLVPRLAELPPLVERLA